MPPLFAGVNRGAVDIVVDAAMPPGRIARLAGSHVYTMHPRDYLACLIELEPGLDYARRSTLHARVRYLRRRAEVRGEPWLWPRTLDELRITRIM